MGRLRILFLSPFADDERGERHSDIRSLLKKTGTVEHQGTSGTYAIRPDSDYPGAIEVAGQRRDQTPTTFINTRMDRRKERERQAQQQIRTRAQIIAQQLREVDCVVAEVTMQCITLGMLIERARAMGLPVLCLRRSVVQLPALPLVEEDARLMLRDVSTPEMLDAAIQAFLARVTHRGASG